MRVDYMIGYDDDDVDDGDDALCLGGMIYELNWMSLQSEDSAVSSWEWYKEKEKEGGKREVKLSESDPKT